MLRDQQGFASGAIQVSLSTDGQIVFLKSGLLFH